MRRQKGASAEKNGSHEQSGSLQDRTVSQRMQFPKWEEDHQVIKDCTEMLRGLAEILEEERLLSP